jgi:hypothetical protein
MNFYPLKLQLLAWAPLGRSHADHARRVHREVVPTLKAAGPARLTVHLTETPPPRWSLVPFRQRPVTLVSVVVPAESASDPQTAVAPWLDLLAPLGGEQAAYRVTESTPVRCPRAWPLGARTPGVGLLALLRRHPALPYADFLREWHGRHTPMSLDIHPLRHYERNVVDEPLTPGAPPYEGIVTEHFDPPADLLNPVRLFGGPLRMVPNMLRVGLHIRRFLDLPRLDNHLVTEYRLMDGPDGSASGAD